MTRYLKDFEVILITIAVCFGLLIFNVYAEDTLNASNIDKPSQIYLSREDSSDDLVEEELREDLEEEKSSATDILLPTRDEASALKKIIVEGRKPVTAASSKEVREKDFKLLIKNKPADLLKIVPGLIAVQHTGGGKADQYFLRGFDSDHGTDIAFFIDKLPINLRSHAHGQGYTDLNFIIPETIELVEVFKGNYYPQFGDFNNAGAVRFVTKDFVPEGYVQASSGLYAVDRFRPIARGVGLFSPYVTDTIKTLAAIEVFYDDGPFLDPNNQVRVNALAKLSWDINAKTQIKIWGSLNYGDWDASGLIPLRAVSSGEIKRFGSVDPTEGGDTQRYNGYLSISHEISDRDFIESDWYLTYYKLNLFSNFTYFLENPILGDGIVQRDKRFYYGTDTRYNRFFNLSEREGIFTLGFQSRADDISPLILANQTDRRQTSVTNDVDIYEISVSPWAELELNLTDWARTLVGIRWDIFHYDVNDNLSSGTLEGDETDSIVSYKANLILDPLDRTEFFLNFGTGFHSNDARVVVSNPSQTTLPRSIGWEVGSRTRLLNNSLDLAGAFWFLYLESELVFVGDAGEFEPKGSTRRFGGELEARYSANEWLSFFGDLNLVHARFTNGDRIPLAPTVTSRLGAAVETKSGFQAIIDYTFIANRPANESNTVETDSFNRVDASASYRYKDWEFFVLIENLLNSKNRDSQFFYESRLENEAEPVEDIHFTAGNPFNFRIGVVYYLDSIKEKLNI